MVKTRTTAVSERSNDLDAVRRRTDEVDSLNINDRFSDKKRREKAENAEKAKNTKNTKKAEQDINEERLHA